MVSLRCSNCGRAYGAATCRCPAELSKPVEKKEPTPVERLAERIKKLSSVEKRELIRALVGSAG